MTWEPKIGEMGRFRAERDRRPRFVIVRLMRTAVQVWYSGAPRTQTIPLQTFKTDCIDGWRVDIVTHPDWLKPKVKFLLDGHVTLAQVTDDHRFPRTTGRTESLDLTGHTLEVFSIFHDHVACSVPSLKTIVLIPVKAINKRGSRLKTRWDRMLEDDEFDDYEDYLA